MIAGQKWGANLWVWNGVRAGLRPISQAPVQQVTAHFSTVDVPEAELFWGDISWGRLPIHGEEAPLGSNTFPGHEWSIKIDEEVVATWIIAADEPFQEFVLRREDLQAPSFDFAEYDEEYMDGGGSSAEEDILEEALEEDEREL